MLTGESPGIRDARVELSQQSLDECLLSAEARQQRHVDVDRGSRLTPSLQRQAPDDAEPPAQSLAECLQRSSCFNDLSDGEPPA